MRRSHEPRPRAVEQGVSLPPFQRFLDAHAPHVQRFLVAAVGPNDADDCFQETFLSRAARLPAPAARHQPAGVGADDRAPQGDRLPSGPGPAGRRRPTRCPSEPPPQHRRRRPRAVGRGAGAAAEAAGRRPAALRERPAPRRHRHRARLLGGSRPPQRARGRQEAARGVRPGRPAQCGVRPEKAGPIERKRSHERPHQPSARGPGRPEPRHAPVRRAGDGRGPARRGLRDRRLALRAPAGRASRPRAWCGWPTRTSVPTTCSTTWRPGSRPGSSRRPPGSTGSAATSTSTSPVVAAAFAPRSTGRSPPASAAGSCGPPPRSRSAASRPTARSRRRPGSPNGSRAAGNALGANPIPIVVPCHRVLRTGGGLGGYTGGVDRKERLLRIEGAL